MAVNFPGPYELRFNYQVLDRQHQFRHSLSLSQAPNVGVDDFTTMQGVSRDGSLATLDNWCEALLAVVAPRFNSANTTFSNVELWSYSPLSFDASFIASYSPTTTPSSGGGVAEASQCTYTFRTVEGGIFKLVLLDTIIATNEQLLYPTGIAPDDAIFDLIVDATASLALGRDTSYPFSAIKVSRGQNESVWRKIHR